MNVNLVKMIDVKNQKKERLARVTALSRIHRSRGNGASGEMNLQTVYQLLFSKWKHYFGGMSQRALPNKILMFYTKTSYGDQTFSKPFGSTYMSHCKNGIEGISDDSEAIVVLSGYLSGSIAKKIEQKGWNTEELRQDLLKVFFEESDKTGLYDLVRQWEEENTDDWSPELWEERLFDVFAVACLRNNVKALHKSDGAAAENQMIEEMLRENLYDFESVGSFQRKYIPVFLQQGGYDRDKKRFTYSQGSSVTLPQLLETNGRAVLIGRDGAGKTTLLLSYLLYYHQLCQGEILPEWYSSDSQTAVTLPYDRIICINGKDIGEKFCYNLENYIQDFGRILHYKNAQPRTLIVVDGLEAVLNSSHDDVEIKPRMMLLVMLRKYLAAHPDVHFLMTATDSAFNKRDDMTKFFSETDSAVYRIVPPDVEEFNAYCDKNKVSDPMREKILRAIRNNGGIKKIINTHLMLSYFMYITQRDSGVIVIRSELQLLREIADLNFTIACADLSIGNAPVNEYDLKSVVALIALMMTERSLKRIAVYSDEKQFPLNDNSMELMLLGERLNSLDRFLTENSCLIDDGLEEPFCPKEGLNESFHEKIEKLIDLLRRSHIPFIRIINDESKQQSYFEFSSPVWQNYFASYALANGIGLERVTSGSARRLYLSKRIEDLCFGEEEQDENMLRAWINIIANASILNREIAKDYIDTIAGYALNPSPKWRKARECATLILLKIFRNNPSVDTSTRLECISFALSYYFYHYQLDDFDAILRFSTHRKSFCHHLLKTFFSDVNDGSAIPRYLFCAGYICYRWIPIAEIEKPRTPEELAEIAMRHIDESEEDCNSAENVAEYCRRFNKGGFTSERAMKPQFLMGVMALCNYYWQGSAETQLTEMTRLFHSSTQMSTSVEINDLLLRLTQYPDWRIRNVACFALTHIGSYEMDCTPEGEVTVIPLWHRGYWLNSVIECDFDARQMAIASNSSEKAPLCGALRLLTLVHVSAEDYGLARNNFTDLSEKETLYRQLWNRYLDDVKRFSDKADYDGNSQRYLALIFKICFLLGIWGENVKSSGSDNPVLILLRLKAKCGDKNLGLKYDREQLLFEDLRAIAAEWGLHE